MILFFCSAGVDSSPLLFVTLNTYRWNQFFFFFFFWSWNQYLQLHVVQIHILQLWIPSADIGASWHHLHKEHRPPPRLLALRGTMPPESMTHAGVSVVIDGSDDVFGWTCLPACSWTRCGRVRHAPSPPHTYTHLQGGGSVGSIRLLIRVPLKVRSCSCRCHRQRVWCTSAQAAVCVCLGVYHCVPEAFAPLTTCCPIMPDSGVVGRFSCCCCCCCCLCYTVWLPTSTLGTGNNKKCLHAHTHTPAHARTLTA